MSGKKPIQKPEDENQRVEENEKVAELIVRHDNKSGKIEFVECDTVNAEVNIKGKVIKCVQNCARHAKDIIKNRSRFQLGKSSRSRTITGTAHTQGDVGSDAKMTIRIHTEFAVTTDETPSTGTEITGNAIPDSWRHNSMSMSRSAV